MRAQLSPSGQYLAAAWGRKLRLINIKTGTEEIALRIAPEPSPGNLVFSPDEKRLAVQSEDFSTQIWDLESKQPIFRTSTQMQPIAFSADGRTLIVSTAKGLQFLRGATEEEVARQRGK